MKNIKNWCNIFGVLDGKERIVRGGKNIFFDIIIYNGVKNGHFCDFQTCNIFIIRQLFLKIYPPGSPQNFQKSRGYILRNNIFIINTLTKSPQIIFFTKFLVVIFRFIEGIMKIIGVWSGHGQPIHRIIHNLFN